MRSFRFYLGTHMAGWLWTKPGVEFFVSDTRLRKMKSFKPALSEWAVDSGGFSELGKHGRWTITAKEYAARLVRYAEEIGSLRWAAPQDWMCEPQMLARTGLSVAEHQERTIDSLLELRNLQGAAHVIPVLQGWEPSDYLRHRERYLQRGIDLIDEEIVGVGTVCRRQSTELVEGLIAELSVDLSLHAFGFKRLGLRRCRQYLSSADSMAWSYDARRGESMQECVGSNHKNCANCFAYAENWMRGLMLQLERVAA